MTDLKTLDERQLIKLAKTSSSQTVLKSLVNNTLLSVRRSLAKNNNIPEPIVNKLAIDSCSNVSYWATRHRNYNKKRVVQSNDACVVCTLDELEYHKICQYCDKKN